MTLEGNPTPTRYIKLLKASDPRGKYKLQHGGTRRGVENTLLHIQASIERSPETKLLLVDAKAAFQLVERKKVMEATYGDREYRPVWRMLDFLLRDDPPQLICHEGKIVKVLPSRQGVAGL